MSYSVDCLGQRVNNWPIWLEKFKHFKCRALEIGSFEGSSAVWFAQNILIDPRSHILCIDAWVPIEPYTSRGTDMEQIYERFKANVAPYPAIIHRRGDSHQMLRGMTACFDWFDFIYIDGSHWPVDVLQDAVLAFDLVRPGGVIIFDDYEWEYKGPETTPKIAIDAFLEIYKGKYKLLGKGYQVAIEKG